MPLPPSLKKSNGICSPPTSPLDNNKLRSRIRRTQHIFLPLFICGYLIWSVTFFPSTNRYDVLSEDSDVDYDSAAASRLMLLAQRKQRNITRNKYRPRLCMDSKTYVTQNPKLIKASKFFGEGLHHRQSHHDQDYYDYWSDAAIQQRQKQAADYDQRQRIYLSNNNNVTTAVLACRFHPRYTEKLRHFAHAMEQLYLCIDYWLESVAEMKHNDEMNYHLFLLYNATDQAEDFLLGVQKTPFLQGVMEVLHTQLHVQHMNIQDFAQLDGLQVVQQQQQPTVESPNFDYINVQEYASHVSADDKDKDDDLRRPPSEDDENDVVGDSNTVSPGDSTVEEYTPVSEEDSYIIDAIPSFRDPLSGFLFRHSQEWNDMVSQHYQYTQQLEDNQSNELEVEPQSHPSSATCTTPRIVILSRKTTRRIVNDHLIARLLSGRTVTVSNFDHRATFPLPRVKVKYFEDADFVQQFETLQHADILISGHGAQLTGLPFMMETAREAHGKNKLQSTCKQLLELYPKHYALPYYFGSLAVQAGIAHSYMYLQDELDVDDHSTSDTTQSSSMVYPWEKRTGLTYKERRQSRLVKLCPDTRVMVDAIVELVRDWYACCTSQRIGDE